jgi:hypothetical protein
MHSHCTKSTVAISVDQSHSNATLLGVPTSAFFFFFEHLHIDNRPRCNLPYLVHYIPVVSYHIVPSVRLHSTLHNTMNFRSLFAGVLGALSSTKACSPPCVPGTESIMKGKAHGTSNTPVQSILRWGCDSKLADRICNFNRHYAEHAGYFEQDTSFLSEESSSATESTPIDFYDPNTGKLLFTAPKDRSFQEFVQESRKHGWPSFRDSEVNWENVRVLPNGETVSVDGTHLGHNLPDRSGNRFCINLVSVAGNAVDESGR